MGTNNVNEKLVSNINIGVSVRGAAGCNPSPYCLGKLHLVFEKRVSYSPYMLQKNGDLTKLSHNNGARSKHKNFVVLSISTKSFKMHV